MVELEFVYSEAEPARLDAVVQAFLLDLESDDIEQVDWTRSQVQRLIRAGQVDVSGITATKSGAIVKPSSAIKIELELPRQSEQTYEPYDFPLKVVHEDPDLLVIDKPAGIAMHPGAGNVDRTLANAVCFYLRNNTPQETPDRAGIVHRLDRDTTGLVVVAKNKRAQQRLAQQFAMRKAERRYQALALSTPRARRPVAQKSSGTVDQPIGRSNRERTKMAINTKNGRRAVTHWNVVEPLGYGVLLGLKLETGRTHQIRVHLESIAAPVIGDKSYGDFSALPRELKRAADEFGRQALHAELLGFRHPTSGEEISFSSPLPSDMQELVDAFRSYSARGLGES